LGVAEFLRKSVDECNRPGPGQTSEYFVHLEPEFRCQVVRWFGTWYGSDRGDHGSSRSRVRAIDHFGALDKRMLFEDEADLHGGYELSRNVDYPVGSAKKLDRPIGLLPGPVPGDEQAGSIWIEAGTGAIGVEDGRGGCRPRLS
jgi:hypothetical protein